MRYFVGLVCVLALGVMGCSETSGTGGTAGDGGSGGDGGGGSGGTDLCQGVTCEDDGNECTGDGVCDPADGMCNYPPVEDGVACDESNECTVGMCASGACDSTPVADGTTCGDGAGTCCSGTCIPEILPVLDGADGIQASVFQASCAFSACHGSNGLPQAGLELSSASVSEANLIDVDSTQVDKLRVAPGDPDASYLVDKLLGRNLAPGTLQQPPVGGPLCDPKIQAVEEWIAAGAN
jgi:hypothetical protein